MKKMLTVQARLVSVLGLLVFLWSSAYPQITPLGDTYINTADPTTNYGSKTLLDVDGAAQITYIQFNLGSIPTTATVSQATLKLYVNSVTTAGSFNVDYVNGAWSENTIDASNAPAPGAAIASNVSVTTADKNQYILINVTSAVQAWLSGSQSNDGIALVANGSFNATFDSKENTTTSHPAELDIAYAGGDGTITGVTTASGSGLTGGGTSGTLNLSLTNACAASQVLQWNGTAWACSNAGTGTITGVTAGTDLTGGGTSGKVTLNLDTTKVPQLATANSFTGNQTVSGNLSATGVVSGSSFEIGSNLFGFGSYANGNAFLGFAGNSATTGTFSTGTGYQALQFNNGNFNTANGVQALYSNTTGYQNTASGILALYANTTGSYNTAHGVAALFSNTSASSNSAFGAYALFNSNITSGPNDAFGYQALYSSTTGFFNEAFGYQALYSNTAGSDNDAFGYQALYNNTTGVSNDAFGVAALYNNTTGYYNSAFGIAALIKNTTGYYNSAFGAQALYNNTTGNYNNAFGSQALSSNTGGYPNDAFGYAALTSNTTGEYNEAFGYQALFFNNGSYNTAVGAGALYSNSTGNSLTCIGYECGASENIADATAIGAHALVEQSNSLVLGGTGEYAVKVGIGTTKPSNVLTIARGAGHPVSDSWDTYSSRRWKTNIHPLENALSKVEQLRGVSYDLKDSGKHEIGVIAEEVGAVVPEVVSYEENGKDARGVDYSRLTALLIEAVKQQQALIRRQQEQIRLQQAEMKAQQAQIAQLGSRVKAIQTTLNINGRTGSEVHEAKAQLPVARP